MLLEESGEFYLVSGACQAVSTLSQDIATGSYNKP